MGSGQVVRPSGGVQVFMRSYKAYSPAFFGKNDINKGNKSK
jgi:hypothetical protein